MASGIIQVILLLLAMGLALLPFFQFFRGTPHQLAAIKQLEESMPAELLEEHEADWFQAWKESGYDQQIFMPYFKQLDNETGTGYRECFSSAAAMVAAFYKKVRTDDEYNKIRAKYGDTTSVEAQLAALRSLGLQAEFRKDGDADMVELEVEAGRPVLVGWLHAGNIQEACCPTSTSKEPSLTRVSGSTEVAKMARTSASVLRPCRAARAFKARCISSGILRTVIIGICSTSTRA